MLRLETILQDQEPVQYLGLIHPDQGLHHQEPILGQNLKPQQRQRVILQNQEHTHQETTVQHPDLIHQEVVGRPEAIVVDHFLGHLQEEEVKKH